MCRAEIVVRRPYFAIAMPKLYLEIPYDQALMASVRRVSGAHWDPESKLWVSEDRPEVREAITREGLRDRVRRMAHQHAEPDAVRGSEREVFCAPERATALTAGSEAVTVLEQMLMLEGAAYSTRKTYASVLRKLTIWHDGDVAMATREDLLSFLTHCAEEKRYSRATMNQLVNALRAYYERVLGRPKDELRLPRPRKQRSLPNVCTEADALRMIRETLNVKHKTILAMIYGLGLRKGEVQKLLVKHVDISRRVVLVRQAKGNKDRALPLQDSLYGLLTTYLETYRPGHWLFEGQSGDQYSGTSIQAIFTRAKERSKLPDQLTVHGLRHSYATHLVERGTPLHVVKDLLGHESIQTTQIYLHTSSERFQQVYDPLAGL